MYSVSQDWARPVVYWELVASDAGRQATFYRELFNWQIGEGAVMPIPAGLGGPSQALLDICALEIIPASACSCKCATSASRWRWPKRSAAAEFEIHT